MESFDKIINRLNTHSVKWDGAAKVFGSNDVLPLWVADMDFPAPEPVIKALIERAKHGIFGYTHLLPSYFQAVKHWMSKRHGWAIESDWIVFSPGVVPALISLVKVLTEPRDKVLIQPPVYPPFFRAIEANNCQLILNPLILKDGYYEIDFEDLEVKLKEGVKLFILCHPHNPVGRVWKKDELLKLIELCKEYNVIIISDEIHSDLIYSNHLHFPLPMLAHGYEHNIIVCTAPSKTFNLAGLQTSNIIIQNPEYRRLFQDELSRSINSPNSFGVVALEAAYNYGEEWLKQLMVYIEGNYRCLNSFLHERTGEIKVIEPEATYMVWLDFRQLGMNDKELQKFLVHECKLGLNPGASFGYGGEGFARMNIACPRATLLEGLKRLEEGIKKINN